MQQEKIDDWYQKGVEFAHEVQGWLREGKTFDNVFVFSPEQAAQLRDIYKERNTDMYEYWKGYLSQWD